MIRRAVLDGGRPIRFGGGGFFHLSALALLLVLAVWAGRWGLAGLHAHPARQLLEGWEHPDRPRVPREPEWRAALDALERARRLEPGNPDHLLTLGRMHHHQARTFPPLSPEYAGHLRQAVAAYRQAAARRPHWGYPWILLAQAQVQSGMVSEPVREALMRALDLAPWSGDVQRVGVRLGFVLWPLLDEPRREVIRQTVVRAFPLHGDEMLRLAFRHGHLELVRPLLPDNPQWQWVHDRFLRLRGQGG